VIAVHRRLLLVYSGFGPYHVARWRAVQAQMAAHGWEVVPVEILRRQDRYDWQDEGDSDGIVRLGFPSDGRDQICWRDARGFLRRVAALRPDVVAVNGWATRDSILLHLWCRLSGVARIVVTDTTLADSTRWHVKECLKRALLGGVGAAFTAGKASQEYVATLGVHAHQITTGCDVIDNAHFAAGRISQTIGHTQRVRLLTVARLIPEKNLIAAAEAFLVVTKNAAIDATWIIAGYGPLEVELKEVSEKSDGRICLLGSVDYNTMPEVIASADILWLPSVSEAWGLVVNEAMAAGLPVAVSALCGCAIDLVTTENGWTFDPSSQAGLREGLLRVLEDRYRWRQMGEASSRIIADWDLNRFASGLFEAGEIALQRQSLPH
jgi:glycosyltransferase involved in cell wall biosynthesis